MFGVCEVFAREDLVGLVEIEFRNLLRREPEAQADGDDAACARAGDKVEVIDDPRFPFFFPIRQKRSREEAFKAPAIKAEDVEALSHTSTL